MRFTDTYFLPDITDFGSGTLPSVRVYRPEETLIVLGQSNLVERDIHTAAAANDHIRIIRRPSGGEVVIVTPETLIISVVFREDTLKNPAQYFRRINAAVVEALESKGVTGLKTLGTSDICIGEKKILGSSIYRKAGRVLYHAVLNLNLDPAMISRYLRHPVREPEYRKGRKHEAFVTSLYAEGFSTPAEQLSEVIRDSLERLNYSW